MSIEKCPNPQPDCKYFPNCFSDKDHLIPQRLGTTALKRAYLNLPQFQEQICRREHDERNARHNRGDTSDIPPFPTENHMRAEIMDAVELGVVSLSKALEKKIGLD
jgi:hypothetical protein